MLTGNCGGGGGVSQVLLLVSVRRAASVRRGVGAGSGVGGSCCVCVAVVDIVGIDNVLGRVVVSGQAGGSVHRTVVVGDVAMGVAT